MDDADLKDIFASLGDIVVKRLFSGKGVYHRGLIVGAVMDGEILLKADAVSEAQFAAAGSTQWVYTYPDGRTIKMPYWTMPGDALDDQDQLGSWLKLAYAAALRSNTTKRPAAKRKR